MIGVRDEKVFVEPDFARFDGVNVYCIRQMYDDTTQIAWVGDNGELTYGVQIPGVQPTPTMRLPMGVVKLILTAFEERGVKTATASELEGTLDATKAHLEDMRRIAYSSIFAGDEEIKLLLAQAIVSALSVKNQ